MTIDITPPPAIVEFAQQNDLQDPQPGKITFGDYTAYIADFKEKQQGKAIILYSNKGIRFALPKEVKEIMKIYNLY